MKKISYYLFSNNSLYSFLKQMIAIIEKSSVEQEEITIFLNRLKASFVDYQAAFSREKVNPFTEKLYKADEERDDRFIGFKTYIHACKYRKDVEKQNAAEEVEKLISRYGNDLYRKAKADESAALDNLIAELNSEAYQPLVSLIAAQDWISEMENDQAQYKLLEQEQMENMGDDTKNFGTTQQPLINACKALISMIELQLMATNDPGLKVLSDQLDALISKSITNARLSNSLSGNDKEVDQEFINE